MSVSDYRDLDAWKLANQVRQRVWSLTRQLEFQDERWLRTQLRRSSHSACANIAEGFARYRPAEFAQFLNIAKGSLGEVAEHLAAPIGDSPAFERQVTEITALARRGQATITRLIIYLRSAQAPLSSKTPHLPPQTAERGTQNEEPRTRNPEPGTQNQEPRT